MGEGTRSMTKADEAVSNIHNTLMASHQTIQEDIRSLTLQLTALGGNFEQSIRNQ